MLAMRIVEKPWGREIWVAVTGHYALKIIEFNKGARSSLQYHQQKHEHIYVDSGKLLMDWENEAGELEQITLRAGEVIENKPLRKHRVTALEDTRLIEVSTPELDDVIRLDDDYDRVDDN